jgi:hypothetical protein
MSDRKLPEEQECPECDVAGMVEQTLVSAPQLISDSKTPMRRAGSGWNDMLKKIKKGSGRNNTIKT